MPLLKRVCGYDLVNVNAESKSAAGIDLLDRTRRLAVQVTVNDTPRKISDTRSSVPGSEFASEFDEVILLFLVRRAPKPPKNLQPCATHTITTLDLDGLISAIRGLEPPVQEKIAAFLEAELGKPKWNQDTRISNLPFESLGGKFIGREEFMADLGAALHTGPSTVIKTVQAIHGMGGVGKTRAAIEYAWRHQAEFHAMLFVMADGPDSLRRNLAALCAPAILNLPQHTATETDTQADAVLDWLRQNHDWLLILDNVDSPDARDSVLALATPLRHGKLLITSRLGDWGTGIPALDLDVLSPEAGVRLLLEHTAGFRIPAATESADAAEIARLVDGLALALEQAAAHIRKIRCSFATYLGKWREAETRLLAEYHTKGVGDYHQPPPGRPPQEALPRSLCVTFDASFRQLGPQARHLKSSPGWPRTPCPRPTWKTSPPSPTPPKPSPPSTISTSSAAPTPTAPSPSTASSRKSSAASSRNLSPSRCLRPWSG